MAPRRHGTAASVVSASGFDDLEAESGIGTVVGSSARKRRRAVESTNIEDITNDCEEGNLARISNYLRGKGDEHTLVLYMTRNGKLKKNVKVTEEEPISAASTNKFNLLSTDNWADIISMVDGVHFEKEHLVRLPKSTLCKLGCLIGSIDPSSAPISRRLRVIASFLKRRSSECYKDQYTNIKLKYNDQGDKIEDIDFTQFGVFGVSIADDKKSGIIVHKGSGIQCAMPDEMIATGGKIHDNHSETCAYFKVAFSDPLITRVFAKANKTLPKLFWIKKVTDFAGSSLTAETLSQAASPGDGLKQAADEALGEEPPQTPAKRPPVGSGSSQRPP